MLLVPLTWYLAREYDLARLVDFKRLSTTLRYRSALGALNAFGEKPLTGHGVGLVYELIRIPEVVRQSYTGEVQRVITVGGQASALEPHNGYLLIAVEYGLTGVILFGAAVVLWLRRLSRARKASSPDWASVSRAYWIVGIVWLLFLATNSDPVLYTKVSLGMWTFVFMAAHNAELVGEQSLLAHEANAWRDRGDDIMTGEHIPG